MSRPQAIPAMQISNERAIVTEWRLPPGAETGWHRHAHDHVIVPMTGGELLLETAEGNRTAPLTPGRSYTRSVGVEHNVINPLLQEAGFIEIEMR